MSHTIDITLQVLGFAGGVIPHRLWTQWTPPVVPVRQSGTPGEASCCSEPGFCASQVGRVDRGSGVSSGLQDRRGRMHRGRRRVDVPGAEAEHAGKRNSGGHNEFRHDQVQQIADSRKTGRSVTFWRAEIDRALPDAENKIWARASGLVFGRETPSWATAS